MREFDRDLIRGGHYGQRSYEPRQKAGHMAAPTNAANVKKVLANPEPSTHDPGCVKTFFLPQKLHATGDYPRRHDGLSIFFFVESRVNPGASSGHAERPERSHDAHNNTSSSRPDCHQERLDADDVHDAREVVGEYVQRHFGRDIGQPLH
jgi:hypothetical protein